MKTIYINKVPLIAIMVLLFGCTTAPKVVVPIEKTLEGPVVVEPEEKEISLLATGDLYLGSRALPYLKKKHPSYPFSGIQSYINNADVVIANLESPLTNHNQKYVEKKFLLKAPPYFSDRIKDSGIDIVTLANNHTMDFGIKGLTDTIISLDRVNLPYTGAGMDLKSSRKPAVKIVDGVSIAVLAYNKTYPLEFYSKSTRPGTAPGYPSYIEKDVTEAQKLYDIVVVAFHWGGERIFKPRDYQKKLGRLAIDSGANLVIGHHPHIVQAVEEYGNGLIFYSLGNYSFGFYGNKNKPLEGMLARVVFKVTGDLVTIKKKSVVPLNVNNWEVHFSPRPLIGAKRDNFMQYLDERSSRLEWGKNIKFDFYSPPSNVEGQ